jgi:hypothetical protein
VDADPSAARHALDAAVADPARLDTAPLTALAAGSPDALDATLRAFADAHGAAALPVLETLTGGRLDKAVRKAARLAERFEHYAWALDYTRRVHFHDAPALPFFRFGTR